MSGDLIPPGAVVRDVLTLSFSVISLSPNDSDHRTPLLVLVSLRSRKDTWCFQQPSPPSLWSCGDLTYSASKRCSFFFPDNFLRAKRSLWVRWADIVLLLHFRALLRSLLLFPKHWIITNTTTISGFNKYHKRKNEKLLWGWELESVLWSKWLWSCYWKINVDFLYSPQHRSIPGMKAAPDGPHMEHHDAIHQRLQPFAFTLNILKYQACVFALFLIPAVGCRVADWYQQCGMGPQALKFLATEFRIKWFCCDN